jgi:predicted Zn-dependent protease
MQTRQFPEAEKAFREQVRLRPPDSPAGLYGLGKALLGQAKHAEALAPLRDLARLDPGNHQAHDALGWALLLAGERAKAEAEFREVIRLKPAWEAGHVGLGRALVEQQKHPDAEAALREALRLVPGHPEATNLLRRALVGQGKKAEAEALGNRLNEPKRPGKDNEKEPARP